ncbi:DUF732 domain-containing protein [Herbiconiux sp. P16]|uniref:DUF732 domain-containing protein n=1 Tax=Herbiconiux wuyangfengii TaxID=3342794 RepID=UPI0035BB1BB6
MPERYVVDPKSGEEILLKDGESPTEGLRRRQVERIDEARADLARRAQAAKRSEPIDRKLDLDQPKAATSALKPERTSADAASRLKRIRLGLTAGGVVVVLGVVAIITTTVVSAGIREQEAIAAEQVRAERLAEQEAEQAAAEKKQQEHALAAALASGQDALATSREFSTTSAEYSTDAQKADLQAQQTELEQALGAKLTSRIEAAIEKLQAGIKLIGTPEEAEARRAAEAQKAIDDQYLASAQAAGVNISDRETALQGAHSYCDSLASSDQVFEVLVATIFSRPRNDAAISSYCPQFADAAGVASRAVSTGSKVVRTDISEGTYNTLKKGVKDCYWERSDGGGTIIDNNFIGFAPDGVSVTVHNGEGFTTSGCGLWILQ